MYQIEFKYRGHDVKLDGETKNDMIEVLAGIDFLEARVEAHGVDAVDAKAAPAEKEKPAKKAPAKKPAPKKEAPVEEAPVEKEPEPEVAEETKPEQAAVEEPKVEGAAAPAEHTLDDVRDAVMAYAKANGNVKGKKLVEKYGATKLSDVPADKWADLFAEATAGVE